MDARGGISGYEDKGLAAVMGRRKCVVAVDSLCQTRGEDAGGEQGGGVIITPRHGDSSCRSPTWTPYWPDALVAQCQSCVRLAELVRTDEQQEAETANACFAGRPRRMGWMKRDCGAWQRFVRWCVHTWPGQSSGQCLGGIAHRGGERKSGEPGVTGGWTRRAVIRRDGPRHPTTTNASDGRRAADQRLV